MLGANSLKLRLLSKAIGTLKYVRCFFTNRLPVSLIYKVVSESWLISAEKNISLIRVLIGNLLTVVLVMCVAICLGSDIVSQESLLSFRWLKIRVLHSNTNSEFDWHSLSRILLKYLICSDVSFVSWNLIFSLLVV